VLLPDFQLSFHVTLQFSQLRYCQIFQTHRFAFMVFKNYRNYHRLRVVAVKIHPSEKSKYTVRSADEDVGAIDHTIDLLTFFKMSCTPESQKKISNQSMPNNRAMQHTRTGRSSPISIR